MHPQDQGNLRQAHPADGEMRLFILRFAIGNGHWQFPSHLQAAPRGVPAELVEATPSQPRQEEPVDLRQDPSSSEAWKRLGL